MLLIYMVPKVEKMSKPRKTSVTHCVDFDKYQEFKKLAKSMDRTVSHLIREFMYAAIENRLRITPVKARIHTDLYSLLETNHADG